MWGLKLPLFASIPGRGYPSPGYGGQIHSLPGPEHAYTEPPCHIYGQHLMCQFEGLTTTSATTTTV